MNRPYVNTLLYPTYRCCGCPQLLELGIIFWTLRVSGWQPWMFSLYILRSHIDNQSISHRIGYTIRWLVGTCSQGETRTHNDATLLLLESKWLWTVVFSGCDSRFHITHYLTDLHYLCLGLFIVLKWPLKWAVLMVSFVVQNWVG